ncbi:MAG TPA: tRNA lysidine(34) synthetase TilS [Solirubrobacteraceae bacterium]|nr:tRNA lysidine(34) synthetase TilS [Solirubrobacteraceae bacterium]
MTADLMGRVAAGGLLAEGRPVVVLFSGGRDSTCLLDLSMRIAGLDAVRALHVNYGLRDAAAADEAHCVEVCASLGVPLEIRRPRRPETGNLQAWAREERYRSAAELAEPLDADVAAGHTATDQVETILYRLASSPSRRALLGMRPREGRVVRPLLGVTREQTAAHCLARGLTWREDASNESDAYARARIRTSLVPALRAIHPAAEENVLALAEVLRAEGEVLDGLVDQVLDGRQEVELVRLRGLPPGLARLVVQRLADRAVGHPAPGTARRAEELLVMADNAMLDLPHDVRAVSEEGILRFVRRSDVVRHPAAGRPS